MADSEISPDKLKEKKKKKAGTTKDKESRKKSTPESELQTETTAPAEVELPQAQPTEISNESSTIPPEINSSESMKKSKKSKSAAKSSENETVGEETVGSRKASVTEEASRKASVAEGAVSEAAASRKASTIPGAVEDNVNADSVDADETPPKKSESNELPPPIESSYVVPPAATKKDVDLLQDLDENKLMELKEAFELFDYDQDGYIDYKDLKLTYQTLGYPDVPDGDIENMISEAMSPLDFDAFVILLGYKTIEMDPEAVLLGALACWDYDNSGLISEDRIKHDLMTWGDKFTHDEAEQAFEEAPTYVGKKGASMIDYIKFSNTLCGLRKKTN